MLILSSGYALGGNAHFDAAGRFVANNKINAVCRTFDCVSHPTSRISDNERIGNQAPLNV